MNLTLLMLLGAALVTTVVFLVKAILAFDRKMVAAGQLRRQQQDAARSES